MGGSTGQCLILVLWVFLSESTVESESCAKDGRNPAPVDR